MKVAHAVSFFQKRCKVVNRNRFVQILNNHIKQEAENKQCDTSVCTNWISYIRDTYSGVYTPTCKFDKYNYQNEYRCVLCSEEYSKLPEKKKREYN